MKKLLFTLSLLGLAASTSAQAQPFFVQLTPVTDASTIVCANFAKQADGSWAALNQTPYSLGIITGIIPPVRAIRTGGYIYNNVDLYTQLDYQCGAAVAVVTAKY